MSHRERKRERARERERERESVKVSVRKIWVCKVAESLIERGGDGKRKRMYSIYSYILCNVYV